MSPSQHRVRQVATGAHIIHVTLTCGRHRGCTNRYACNRVDRARQAGPVAFRYGVPYQRFGRIWEFADILRARHVGVSCGGNKLGSAPSTTWVRCFLCHVRRVWRLWNVKAYHRAGG